MEKEIEIPADVLSVMFQNEFVPIGSVQCFAMITPPQGYLICDGKEYPCCVYPDLYKAIGNTFGGINNHTFCVPDLRGQFVRGWDSGAKVDEKRKFGTKQIDAFQQHSHMYNFNGSIETDKAGEHGHRVYYDNYRRDTATLDSFNKDTPGLGATYKGDYGTNMNGVHAHKINLNGKLEIGNPQSEGFPISFVVKETRPKNVALQYCIKAISLVGFTSGASCKLKLNIAENGNIMKSDMGFSEKEKNEYYDLIKEECMRQDISTTEDFLNAAGQYIHENSLLNRVFGVPNEPLQEGATEFDQPIYFLVEFVRKYRNYSFLPKEASEIREMIFWHVNNFVSR